MALPESKPKKLPEDTEFFAQAEFLMASDHRDLFVHSLGDDLGGRTGPGILVQIENYTPESVS